MSTGEGGRGRGRRRRLKQTKHVSATKQLMSNNHKLLVEKREIDTRSGQEMNREEGCEGGGLHRLTDCDVKRKKKKKEMQSEPNKPNKHNKTIRIK